MLTILLFLMLISNFIVVITGSILVFPSKKAQNRKQIILLAVSSLVLYIIAIFVELGLLDLFRIPLIYIIVVIPLLIASNALMFFSARTAFKGNKKMGSIYSVALIISLTMIFLSSYLIEHFPPHTEPDSPWESIDKPVIYLYNYDGSVDVSLELEKGTELSCTYPDYGNGWSVSAKPDGHLSDRLGKTYRYLYYEGKTSTNLTIKTGDCVKGSNTAEFLEQKLSDLGLNNDEINEFIIYWLPLMENNPYNIISFDSTEFTNAVSLNVNPKPDNIIRVYMTFKKSDSFVNIPKDPSINTNKDRSGKTVVEWGGSQLHK